MAYGGWRKFYGLPDVQFTVPNDMDDPTIFYNGKYYNYYDIEDFLWELFGEFGGQDENEFEGWVKDNASYVYEALENATPKKTPGRGVTRPESGKLRGTANSSMRIRRKSVTASKKEVRASRTPITAAFDSDMKIIVKSKGYVDVTLDDYENGALDQVNSWDFDVRGTYSTAQELIDAIANATYVFSNKIDDYYFMDGSIRTSAEVDADNDVPSDAQYEAWKRGEENLFIADLYLSIEVGSESHEMTDEEAESFGFNVE